MARPDAMRDGVLLAALWLLAATFRADPSVSPPRKTLTLGVILPHTAFSIRLRAYYRRILFTLDDFKKHKYPPFKFLHKFAIDKPEVVTLQLTPSPADILHTLCDRFLTKNVSAILYITNSESFGSNTASAQYFLQLAGYLGVPVICWNADNSGLETDQKLSPSINLQLAPSVVHQSLAMLSILRRYSWHQFSIVTSHIAGHANFIEAVKDHLTVEGSAFKYTLLSTLQLDASDEADVAHQLGNLRNSDARIILLYATRDHAARLLEVATTLGLTGKDYVWIVTQSIIGGTLDSAPAGFPPGMLGLHFDTSEESLLAEIDRGVRVFGHALELLTADEAVVDNITLQPNLSCTGKAADTRWAHGELFYRYLLNVSVSMGGYKPNLEFNADGTMRYAELEVVNLNNLHKWDKIGTWTPHGLDIKDIVWPGNTHMPPPGVPERFHLKLTFLEEPPFIHLNPPDPVTGNCINRGVHCWVVSEAELAGTNQSAASRNTTLSQCCSGFCIDLLRKFAADLRFTFELWRVEDGVWGTEVNGKWNGLVASLLNHKTDAVLTAFNINSHREAVIDFTVPFIESGISVVVAKRTGIVSPKAFLEPFDTVSWLLIILVSIQVATLCIFLFEWLSPAGYDMKVQPPRDHKFSLFRTYWMVWGLLFGAAVNVDCPRGLSSRFMSNAWAMFAVVFLAIYTANLAAFMITREEFYSLTGVEDKMLLNPYSMKPPFRYGTIPFGNTEVVLHKSFPAMYSYMRHFNRPTVREGVLAVKRGDLDAFIYDATVLDYLVGQDEECKLLTVGSWYAMNGYGLAFPRHSKHLEGFNKYMMVYRENGELERLRRFWMAGVCQPHKQKRTSSKPLSLNQFMSAFLLLTAGIFLSLMLLGLEKAYFKYMRVPLAKRDAHRCCGLISMSVGQSLSFQDAVYEAQDLLRNHRCRDPLCDAHLWKVKHELDVTRLHIRALERQLQRQNTFLLPRTPYSIECPEYGSIKAYDPRRAWTPPPPAPGQPDLSYVLRPRVLDCRTHVTEIETVL